MSKRERVLTLAGFLEKIPASSLSLSWGIPDVPTKESTIGCPLGWATVVKEFQAEGLEVMGKRGEKILVFEGAKGLAAAQAFFGLTFEQVWAIFTPDGYTNSTAPLPFAIAARLRLAAKGMTE